MDVFQQSQSDSWEKVKEIIVSKGIPINAEWLDYAILDSSLECGRKDVAELVLERECRVNKTEYVPHNTPLHNAVILEDAELVVKLLNKGASVTALNAIGNSPLHLAFKYRQDNIVDHILNNISETSNFINATNPQGLTHLHIASTRKNKKLIRDFLAAGANINDAINVNSSLWPGYTAMHFAIEFGSLEAANILQNANGVTYTDASDKTPLQMAYEKAHETSIMAHILSSENYKPLILSLDNMETSFLDPGHHTFPSYFHLACMRKNPKVVEEFIKNGAEVNTPISRKAVFCPMYTPLHFAVESDCAENVKILLKHGADAKLKNNDNMTSLHLALYNDDVSKKSKKDSIVNMLYDALENKEEYAEDKNGMTYMHIACTRNDVSLVKHYLDGFQSVNSRIQRNLRKFSLYTPLHFAVRYRAFEVAKLLVEESVAKADVNAHDNGESGTPLHLACEIGHPGMIDLLLRNGAKANALRVKDRKTAVHLLVESYIEHGEENLDLNGFVDFEFEEETLLTFIEKLVELGAHVNAKDIENRTALHIACYNFWDGAECAKKLLDTGVDVNVEDGQGSTALMEALITCDENFDDLAVFYHHVQKLKALGLKVNSKNDQFCQDFLKNREEWYHIYDKLKDDALAAMELQRQVEIAQMKNVMIDSREKLSLFNFVVCDARSVKKYAQNKVVEIIVESENLTSDYPSFAFLIKLQYQRALKSLEGGGRNAKKRAINNENLDAQVKQKRLN